MSPTMTRTHPNMTRIDTNRTSSSSFSLRGRKNAGPRSLHQNVLDHLPAHIGQAEVAAAVAVGEAFVVEAHQVEDGGVQVVGVGAFFLGTVAELVGGAVSHAAAETAAGDPERKAPVIVIAAV